MKKSLLVLVERLAHTATCDDLTRNARGGICSNALYDQTRSINRWAKRAMKRWPHYSGDPIYPVPGDSLGVSTSEAFNYAMWDRSMWDERTEYGRLRWDLLRFLLLEAIKELERAQ